MKTKERGLRELIKLIYLSWGYSTPKKTFYNGAKTRNPLYLEHKSGKKLFIEILEKPSKKKEDEISRFYDNNENYKIIYLSNFSQDLKSLTKRIKKSIRDSKKTKGANPVNQRHEMPLLTSQ